MSRDELYLLHIRDAILRIRSYTVKGKGSFLAEPIIQDAVIRNFEIIGEAVKGLSSEFVSANPSVPFKQIAGMRDRLIHGYFGVDLEIVWAVIEKDLSELDAVLKNSLKD